MEGNENRNNDEVLDQIIDKKLNKINLNPLIRQDENIIDFLRRIENAIQLYETKRNNCIEEYKRCKINHLKISKETGISRVTINTYKDILGDYINKSVEIQKLDDLFEKVKESKHEVEDLMNIISKMQIRDIIIENQSIEIEELKDNITKSDEIIKNLDARNEQLIKEITEARKELSSYKVRRI